MERASDIKIDYNTRTNIADFVSKYDKESDTLTLRPKISVPSVSVDFNGDFWVRIDPKTDSIVGVDIEEYKGYFAKRYSKHLRGKRMNDPFIKRFVIALLVMHSDLKPHTKQDYIKDLDKVIVP